MIASVRGPVAQVGAGYVIIEVGGVGVRVETPSDLRAPRAHRGEELSLRTSLVVREDSLTLFGFETDEELDVFERLLGVSGVGPRSALGVLSQLSPGEIAAAVAADDDKPFRRAPGIGPKTAKLITVSLAGKLDHITVRGTTPDAGEGSSTMPQVAQVLAGLTGLGWSEAQAAEAIDDAIAAGSPTDTPALMRSALILLQTPRNRGTGR